MEPGGATRSEAVPIQPASRLLLVFSIVLVIVSTPLDAPLKFSVYFLLLLLLTLQSRVSVRRLLLRLLVVIPFVAVIAVSAPFLARPGETDSLFTLGAPEFSRDVLWFAGMTLAKALLCVWTLVLLGATTPSAQIAQGLRRLHMPAFFVQILEMTVRYIELFSSEMSRLRTATASRGYRARHLWQAGTLGRLAGAQFLRSLERGERVYLAMLARGYGETVSSVALPALRVMDWLVPALGLALMLLIRLWP